MVAATMTDIRTIVGEPLEYFGGGIYQILLFGTERRYVGRSIGVAGRLSGEKKMAFKLTKKSPAAS
jgi:hypothetical protein